MNFFKRDRTFREPIGKLTTFFMVAFHIGAIAALFMFTWKALFVALLLWWVAGSLGIGIAYHRLLTHRGFKTYKWFEYFITVCATLALEGGPFFWVATHRVHHQNTDVEGDPHSPKDGGLWAHMGWIMTGRTLHNHSAALLPYIPDLRKDKFHTFISRWHWVPITALGIGLLVFGGWSVMLWGIFFRTTVGLHATWLVNSATHKWGSIHPGLDAPGATVPRSARGPCSVVSAKRPVARRRCSARARSGSPALIESSRRFRPNRRRGRTPNAAATTGGKRTRAIS